MRRSFLRALVLALLFAIASCAKAPRPRAPDRIARATSGRVRVEIPDVEVPSKLVENLALMTIGTLPTEEVLARSIERLTHREVTMDAFIDELLDDKRFPEDVAPEIVFNQKAVDVAEEVPWEVLGVLGTPAAPAKPPVYFLRKPCAESKAEKVHPWWAMDTEILVCPDSHQPKHLRDPKTGWYCGGSNLLATRSPYCGCGPNLMSCARDEEMSQEMLRGIRQELTKTVAHIVAENQPISRVFTANETVRTRESELLYRRWRVVSGELTSVGDLKDWPKEGKLAPREESMPGQHAGLLTAPQLLLFGDTPRARMRNLYASMWCETQASVNVSTEEVLALGVSDLRDGAGWKNLAAMPVCTGCHARLDYGMQFFSGYPSSFVGVVFDPHAYSTAARGPTFGASIDDPRGEAALTPQAFAELAVAQPELATCMVRDVLDHVLGSEATPDDERALLVAFAKAPTLKALMHEGLLRFANRGSGEKMRLPARSATARTPPAHRATALLRLIDARAGGHEDDAATYSLYDVDRHDAVQITPSFILGLSAAALRACNAAGRTDADLDACLKEAIDVGSAIK